MELNRKPTECTCKLCVEMCTHSPCFPTPEQAEQIMKEGYHLSPSLYLDAYNDDGTPTKFPELYPVLSPHIVGDSCQYLINDRCFLHDKGLKPLEGQLAHHSVEDKGLRVEICNLWNSEKGVELMHEFDAAAATILMLRHVSKSFIEHANRR